MLLGLTYTKLHKAVSDMISLPASALHLANKKVQDKIPSEFCK